MSRLIGMACPVCGHRLAAIGELIFDDCALCIDCGATLELRADGALQVVSEEELARMDAEIRRTLQRAFDEIEQECKPRSTH